MVRRARHHLDGAESTASLTPRALTRQEFGRRLSAMILAKNWSQADAARASKLGRDSISTYINGKTFPTPKNLKMLADALGIEPHELLPNGMMEAIDNDHPEIELRSAAGHGDKAWLRINRAMSFSTAARIIELINQEDDRSA